MQQMVPLGFSFNVHALSPYINVTTHKQSQTLKPSDKKGPITVKCVPVLVSFVARCWPVFIPWRTLLLKKGLSLDL